VPLVELQGRRPDLFVCRHPVALEVAGSEPRACWTGVVVSAPYQQLHRLDRTRTLQLYDRAITRPG
jgi:hypothetical protein